MAGVREWMWVGLLIGAIWAFEGIEGAALTAAVGAVGLLLGVLVEQNGGVRGLLQRGDDRV